MLNNIAIITTLRCDLKCQHCLRGYPKERPDFPMDLLDKLLTKAMPFGAKHVGLTGGEPHLHPEFEKMVEKIVAYGYTWHFVSNGQQTKPYLRVLERYKDNFTHVTLSIDGATAKTHDDIRQRKGAFGKVTASARKYVELGYKVRVSTTLNRRNKQDVEALVELARNLGASQMNFGGTIPTSWNQDLVLSDDESRGTRAFHIKRDNCSAGQSELQLIARRAWHRLPRKSNCANAGQFRSVFGGQQFEAGDWGCSGSVG